MSTDYSHAEKLKHELTQPLFNPMLKKWVGNGDLDYERYLHTGTLLGLQSSEAERVSHDELMFQIVHQSQELYLKLASREIVEVVAELDRDALWAVVARLARVQRILQCISSEMAILETMTPEAYQVIRRSLGNGSGQESPGYNTFRLAATGLESAMERMLQRRDVTLMQIYMAGGHEDLKHVCENLVTMDEAFQGWLYAHFQLVRRTIGVDRSVKALDGLPTQVLAGRMTLPLFRALWDVRVEMTSSWKREGGYATGASRGTDAHAAPRGGGCPMMMHGHIAPTAMHAHDVAAMHAAHAHAAPTAAHAAPPTHAHATPAPTHAHAAPAPHTHAAPPPHTHATPPPHTHAAPPLHAHAVPAPHTHAAPPPHTHAAPTAYPHPHELRGQT